MTRYRPPASPLGLYRARKARAIEAAIADETTEIGSTEGKSAVPKECAQKGPA